VDPTSSGPLSTIVVAVRLIIQVSVSHRSAISLVVRRVTVAPIIWSTCPNAVLLRAQPATITPIKVFSFIPLVNAEA
jgi:hypothetical protein